MWICQWNSSVKQLVSILRSIYAQLIFSCYLELKVVWRFEIMRTLSLVLLLLLSPFYVWTRRAGWGSDNKKLRFVMYVSFCIFFFFYGFHYHGFFSIITGLKKFLKCSSKKDINERQEVWKFTHKFYNWILLRQMSTYSGEKSKGPIIWDFTRIDGFY